MTTPEVYERLCWYDKRNPNYVEQNENDIRAPRILCVCDNCFYGRDKMAMEIIKLQEEITALYEQAAGESI